MAHDDFAIGGWLAQPSLDRLQSADRTLHLRPKTMQVLVALAEHAGELVSRESLHRTIWPDVHVADEGLNHCIAELRAAFDDDVSAPRFIETVAKHGYRLVVPVSAAADPPQEPEAPQEGHLDATTRRRRARTWGFHLIGLALLVLTSAAVVRSLGTTARHGRVTVLMADWRNRTADSSLDNTLMHALAIRLGESPDVRLLSRERVAFALQLIRQPTGAPLVGEVARNVCRRLGGDVVIDGEVANLGKKLVIMLEANSCTGSGEVSQAGVEANSRDEALPALDRAADKLREAIGHCAAAYPNAPRPVEEVTTSSVGALRAYDLAGEALERGNTWEAISLYEHALVLDPEFALAHGHLATTLAGIREWKRASEHRDRALALVSRLTERERLYVKASHALGRGDVGGAEAALTTWVRLYPKDRVPFGWLAGGYLNRGDRALARAWAETARRSEPVSTAQVGLAATELSLGRLDAAQAVATNAGARPPLYVLAYVTQDAAAMQKLEDTVAPGSFEELDLRARQAQVAAATGKLRLARRLTGEAEQIGLRMNLRELTAQVLATQAVWEAELGNAVPGIEWAMAALSLDDNPTTRALGVLAFARAEAVSRAESLLGRTSGSASNVDPAVVAGARHKLRAAVDLARGRPDVALDDLAGLGAYEYGGVVNLVALRGDVAELGVFHLRGRAYLSLGQGDKAAAEFTRILDNRTISPLSPYVALAPLNLARAYKLAGNRSAALRAYEQFLGRWREADNDVPLLAQARRESEAMRPVSGSPDK